MESFYIEATEFTPKVELNPNTGKFELTGVSRPENVSAFYNRILLWLKDFEKSNFISVNAPIQYIAFNFILTYCNSSSTKFILQILEVIKTWATFGIKLEVNWFYDENDEKMREDGQDLSDALEMEFNYTVL